MSTAGAAGFEAELNIFWTEQKTAEQYFLPISEFVVWPRSWPTRCAATGRLGQSDVSATRASGTLVHMANVDPIRRAEIGREKRARTRAQLIAAARSLFGKRPVESVTVDDVVEEAGVAKGTFYVHFEDLNALTAAVADELVRTFDELLQSQRLSMPDPVMRIAFACNAFIEKALEDPSWGAVVARMAWSYPTVGRVARSRLREDLKFVLEGMPQQETSLELSLEVTLGIMLQVLAAISQGRLSFRDQKAAIGSILRATGVTTRQVKSTLAHLPQFELEAGNAVAGKRQKIRSKERPIDSRKA
jgi:AcrR family transcriptional regulator